MKQHVNDFLDMTIDARELSERCRDYKNGAQWTEQEVAKLRKRNQAPIVDNRIKPKVEGLKGLLISRRTDPKAYGRTPKHEKSSHAITDALRYCADKAGFDSTKLDCAEDLFVEGYGGVIVENSQSIVRIPWDRIYYDPYSTRRDFKDSRFMGIMLWMDKQDFIDEFGKEKWNEAQGQWDEGEGETFQDKPRWYKDSQNRPRVRVAEEFYLKKDQWRMKVFSGDVELSDEVSPYVNEEGEPTNPIELMCTYIDRDNNRFSEVSHFLDNQDEVNHRRSKYLALLSQRQTASKKGAISNIPKMKRELAKANGHVEYDGEKGDFEVLNNQDMADAQFNLLQHSLRSLDSTSFNAQLSGERQGDLSGSAVDKLQSAGLLETQSLFDTIKNWELRIYTQIWWRIKVEWDEEKWIKVTDEYDSIRYVGFNAQITFGQKLQELAEDRSAPPANRQQAQQVLQFLSQAGDSRLNQIMEERNEIPELEMDIIIEQSPDTINWQREQLGMMFELAQARPELDVTDILELTDLRNKDELISNIEFRRQQALQLQAQQTQSEEQRKNLKAQGEYQKDSAQAAKTGMEALTQQLKNQLMVDNPPEEATSVSL